MKWFVDDGVGEADVDQAMRLLAAAQRGDALLVQPPHWVSEVAAVLARLTPNTVRQSVDALLALSFVNTMSEPAHYQRAISIALELDHHLFDTFYHAVGLEENATLITADKRYYEKAKSFGAILMLEDFDG